ncbi:MAG: hypothetical protein ACBZ72_02240 [Candidatus Bathyarchaeia archaeon]|jgi:hypothetical protein
MNEEKKVLLRNVRTGEVTEMPLKQFEAEFQTKPWPSSKKEERGYADVWCEWKDGSTYHDKWAEKIYPPPPSP